MYQSSSALNEKMSFQCCFKSCKNSLLTQTSARVEIKSAIPKSGLTKHKGLLVSWKKNGEAVFHQDCWTTLLTISRRRISVKRKRQLPGQNDELVMIQSEKVMIKEASKTVEKFDSIDDIEIMARKTAELMKKSKHCVFFTGAGISTSAGLGDYRGKGGKWTEQEREALDMDRLFDNSEESQSEASPAKIPRSGGKFTSAKTKNGNELINNQESTSESTENEIEEEDIVYENLRPTFTHESISKLVQLGHVKYLISQNCDGLHLLSGIPSERISELHGNIFVEKCEKCARRYERSYYVCDDIADMYLEELSDLGKTDIIAPKHMKKCELCELSHRTGRRCNDKACKGYLIDTIINFGDHLEDRILDRAFEASDSCDLMICLGTTLAVTPANELVDYVRNPRHIVICNRQPTEKDEACLEKDANGEVLGVRVYGDCDVFMRRVMLHLLNKTQFDDFEKESKAKASDYDDIRQLSPGK